MTQTRNKTDKDGQLIIRLARNRDTAQIIQVQIKSLKVLAAKDYSSGELEALLNSKSRARAISEIIFVAEIQEQIVGFVALDRFTRCLAGLFVLPDYTRRGIGTKLLERAEQEAIKLNISVLRVCSSLTGHQFYLANQYQEVGHTSIYLLGEIIPCVSMRKRLLEKGKYDFSFQISMLIVLMMIAIIIVRLGSG